MAALGWQGSQRMLLLDWRMETFGRRQIFQRPQRVAEPGILAAEWKEVMGKVAEETLPWAGMLLCHLLACALVEGQEAGLSCLKSRWMP